MYAQWLTASTCLGHVVSDGYIAQLQNQNSYEHFGLTKDGVFVMGRRERKYIGKREREDHFDLSPIFYYLSLLLCRHSHCRTSSHVALRSGLPYTIADNDHTNAHSHTYSIRCTQTRSPLSLHSIAPHGLWMAAHKWHNSSGLSRRPYCPPHCHWNGQRWAIDHF